MAGCNTPYGVAVGLVVGVGVELIVGVEVGPLTVDVEVGLVGLLTGGVKVGIVDGVGVGVGVLVNVATGSGGQVWSLIGNCRQLLPAHTSKVIKVLLGA